MSPFAARLPTMMSGTGKIGYLYAKGEADGSWRITDKELSKHELVGACDSPDAMIPRLRDHLEAWCNEQAKIVEHNLIVLDRSPERRHGFRPGWKVKERQIEREALKRAIVSAGRVLQAVASVAQAHGWPIDGYYGPILDLTEPGVLVERG
jgi:hypothetical protein